MKLLYLRLWALKPKPLDGKVRFLRMLVAQESTTNIRGRVRVRPGEPRDCLHTCDMDSLFGAGPEHVCRDGAAAQEAESASSLSLSSHQCKSSLEESCSIHLLQSNLHKPHIPQGDRALGQWLIVMAYHNQGVSPALSENRDLFSSILGLCGDVG